MLGGFVRWIGFLTIVAAVVGSVALLAGYLWFAWHLPDEHEKFDQKADGIVVLTGAASRIPDAIELLATGHGQRLLITGVHRATSAREITRLMPLNQKVFSCCVDLDRSALNTLGNAIETKRWASERGFHSLIIVTSNYHMPRAMVELSHQLPEVNLIPFPVVSENFKNEPWWSSATTAKLVFFEYMKYLFAVVRMRVDPDFA